MPATSKSQQRLFGMVHAYQKGKLKNAPESVKRIAGSISKTDAKHFAQTKHDGLPERKEEKAAELVKRAWRAAESFREENGPYGFFGPGGVAERYSLNIGSDGAVSSNLESKSTLVERQEKKAMAMTITPYQIGFMSKCAAANLDADEMLLLMKFAAPTTPAAGNSGTGSWWDSTKSIAKDFYNNNKTDLRNMGIAAAVGGGLNMVRNWMRPKEERRSTFGSAIRGGLFGGLAYGGIRGGQYIDRNYNNGAAGNWMKNKWNGAENWYNRHF